MVRYEVHRNINKSSLYLLVYGIVDILLQLIELSSKTARLLADYLKKLF